MLVFNVHPADAKNGRIGISLLPESGEQASCELQILLDARRAQFGPGSLIAFADKQKSLREGGAPHRAHNYAIENLLGVDQPFTVRVIVKGCEKIGGSLVDAEIAGQRTMISYRPDLTVKKLAFRTEGVELRNIQIASLKEVKGSSAGVVPRVTVKRPSRLSSPFSRHPNGGWALTEPRLFTNPMVFSWRSPVLSCK